MKGSKDLIPNKNVSGSERHDTRAGKAVRGGVKGSKELLPNSMVGGTRAGHQVAAGRPSGFSKPLGFKHNKLDKRMIAGARAKGGPVGPSIAVMLGHDEDGEGEDHGEPGLKEAEESAKDAGHALGQAMHSGDGEAIYRAFRALSTLCDQIDDLEDSGEKDEEPEGGEEEEEEEPEDEDKDEEG